MDKKFTSDEVPLGQLLDQARRGSLQLPDFQRGWVWDDNHIASLLASVSLSYPIGAVMTLQTGNPAVRFRPRAVEGVHLDTVVEPEFLLLDGQQRITSLYLALRSGTPVPTRDTRKNDLSRVYFADIKACLDPFRDREEAIISVPAEGVVKTFRGDTVLDVSTTDAQIAAEMFPLDIVLDYTETMSWQLAYLQHGPGTPGERFETWRGFNEAVINAFVHYQVPTIELARSTPKEAVCQVFEKVNTGGVSLTVFELLTATYAADDFNLRADWTALSAGLAAHQLLDQFEATDFLQILTLLSTFDRRRQHLGANPGDDKAPAVSCKRRDVLRLELADYRKWVGLAVEALERVVRFLHAEHIYGAPDLPYATQLVPLTAIFVVLDELTDSHGVRQMLQQWYWCGVLGEMYGGSTETRFANDLQDVTAWITAQGDEPRTVREAQFQAGRLLTLRTRNSAAYKGVYALQMKRGGRDFRTGNTIDIHAYFDDAIDVRHIFPQRWCRTNRIPEGIANSVVNKTAIDARTHRRIGGNAPSKYLATIESQQRIDPAELDVILRSHDVDAVALRRDDFPAFFNSRFERLLKQIEAAMGKPVNRTTDRTESPFVGARYDVEVVRNGIQSVITAGESKVVEFKSTGRKNLLTGQRDVVVEWSVIKSIAGFMNANGGTLLVGVADDGAIVGIEEDFSLLGKPDQDGWELWLTDITAATLGKVAAAELNLHMGQLDGRTVARIDVGPAARPVFATPAKGEKKQVFLVRINNSTQELTGQEALDYQKKRWPN
ncbi:MAG: GmrSD restriction endonuclease domain-containing protein [Pseudonocardiaceae bacterium]